MTATRVRAAAAMLRGRRGMVQVDIREALAEHLDVAAGQLEVLESVGVDAAELGEPEYRSLVALVAAIEQAHS